MLVMFSLYFIFLSDIPPQFQDKMAQVVGLHPWSDWLQSGFSLPRTPRLLPHCPTGPHLRLWHHPTAHLMDILLWNENEGAVAQCFQTKDHAHTGWLECMNCNMSAHPLVIACCALSLLIKGICILTMCACVCCWGECVESVTASR